MFTPNQTVYLDHTTAQSSLLRTTEPVEARVVRMLPGNKYVVLQIIEPALDYDIIAKVENVGVDNG